MKRKTADLARKVKLSPKIKKLSWKKTAAEMSREKEVWHEFESVVGDGLDAIE